MTTITTRNTKGSPLTIAELDANLTNLNTAKIEDEDTRASIRPSLLLAFDRSPVLDPRVSFSRASSATYFDSLGVLRTAPANTPRFEFDPITHLARGLLIEEQRTNLFTRSIEFDSANWAKSNATVSANQIVAPDGTLSADLLVEDTTNAQHLIGQSIGTVTLGSVYTTSVYAKAGTSNFILLTAQNAGYQGFNLAAGTLFNFGTAGLSNASITHVGNGWYRCSVTVSTQSTNGTFYILNSNGASNQYTGTGAGVYIWGAQLEVGAFPTSYIPTGASSATRTRDVFDMQPISSWHNMSEGTVVFDGVFCGHNNSDVLFSIDNGSNANDYSLYSYWLVTNSSMRMDSATNNASQAAMTHANVDPNVPFKFAGAYKTNDFASCLNAGTVVTDTVGTVPSNITRLRFGTSGNSSNDGSIWVRRFAYYPKRLSNTELQNLTL